MYVKINNNSLNSAEFTQNLKISLLDLSKTDDSNTLDIVNNMNMIGNDIISYYSGDDFYEIDEKNINTNFKFNVQDDNLCGVEYNLKFISKMTGCIIPSDNLKCSSSVIVPDRPESPYLFPVTIKGEGGVKPYFINKNYVDLNENTFNATYQYAGSDGTIEYLEDSIIFRNSGNGTDSGYPRFKFNMNFDITLNKTYKIKTKYKINEPQNIRFRIGDVGGTIRTLSFTELEGELEIEYTPVSANNLNIFQFIFFGGAEIKVELFDFKLTEKIEFEEEIVIERTFGDHSFKVLDSAGNVCNTSINIEVPTPNSNIRLLRAEKPNRDGFDGKLYLYTKANERVYINWGDGSPIEYYHSDVTLTQFYYHTYQNTDDFHSIDIYGDGLSLLYTGGNVNPINLTKEYFQKNESQDG